MLITKPIGLYLSLDLIKQKITLKISCKVTLDLETVGTITSAKLRNMRLSPSVSATNVFFMETNNPLLKLLFNQLTRHS